MAITLAAGPAAPGPTHAAAPLFGDAGWPLVMFIWAVFAVATAATGFSGSIDALSTDDAMRLAQARDLLAGQSWFDLVQARLNPPDGVPMHWSRLVDLPIALLLATAERLLPGDDALRLVLTAWPLALFLPALLAAASASRSVAGPSAGALGAFLLVLSPGVTSRFAPGAIDHHGAQIALALTMLACTLRIDASRAAAAGAGACAAAMTAIGMETAPHVAACAALVAIRWAVEGEPVARGAAWFGASFAAGTALVAGATVAPETWLSPVCDALGIGHVAAAGIGGLGLALATRFAGATRGARVLALGQIAVAVGAAILIAAPNCLASPYGALPERLRTDWLANVQEAQTIFGAALREPTAAMAIDLALALILAAAVWTIRKAPREARWRVWTAAGMFAAALCVTVWQVRGASLAFALGAPFLPAIVIAAGRAGGRLRAALAAALLNPATMALAGLGVASLIGLPALGETGPAKRCPVSDYRALARLPQGLALNTTDTGPYILAFSPLAAVAAPYHRNVDGLMAEIEAFTGTEEAARAVAVSRNAAYVVVCPLDGGVAPEAAARPDGFSARLMSGTAPAWLQPVDLGQGVTLKAWRVVAGR